jgi:hypothetical protein
MAQANLTPEQMQMLQQQLQQMEPLQMDQSQNNQSDEPTMQDFAESLATQMQNNDMNYDMFNDQINNVHEHMTTDEVPVNEDEVSGSSSSYFNMLSIPKDAHDIALVAAIVFMVMQPMLIKQLMGVGPKIASNNGVPTMIGLLMVALIAGVVFYAGRKGLKKLI